MCHSVGVKTADIYVHICVYVKIDAQLKTLKINPVLSRGHYQAINTPWPRFSHSSNVDS